MIDYEKSSTAYIDNLHAEMEQLLKKTRRQGSILLAQEGNVVEFFKREYYTSRLPVWRKVLPSVRKRRKQHLEIWKKYANRYASLVAPDALVQSAYPEDYDRYTEIFNRFNGKPIVSRIARLDSLVANSETVRCFLRMGQSEREKVWFKLLDLVTDDFFAQAEVDFNCGVLIAALTTDVEEALTYAELPEEYLRTLVDALTEVAKRQKKLKSETKAEAKKLKKASKL